jgi:hypothetical protein
MWGVESRLSLSSTLLQFKRVGKLQLDRVIDAPVRQDGLTWSKLKLGCSESFAFFDPMQSQAASFCDVALAKLI